MARLVHTLGLLATLAATSSACTRQPFSPGVRMRGAATQSDTTSSSTTVTDVQTQIHGDTTTAQLSASATTAQRINAGAELQGANVVFPPGSLGIDTEVSLTPGGSLASDELIGALGLGVETDGISEAGSAMVIDSSAQQDPLSPFTVSLPLGSGSALDDLGQLIVIYLVKNYAAGSNVVGVIPTADLTIGDAGVTFAAGRFGSYQLMRIKSQAVTGAKQASTSQAILTKAEAEKNSGETDAGGEEVTDDGPPVDVTAPPVPTLRTEPGSPSSETAINVTGETEPGAVVTIFGQPGCAGAALSTLPTNNAGVYFASVSVTPDATTYLSAHASDDANNTSSCSEVAVYSIPHLLRDIRPADDSGLPNTFEAGEMDDGRLLFAANDGSGGTTLWITDGTEAGTTELQDSTSDVVANPKKFTSLGGKTFFYSYTTGVGQELWVTQGTPASTLMVTNFNGEFDGVPIGSEAPLAMEDYVLYRGDNGTSGVVLFRTDGSTIQVAGEVESMGGATGPFGLVRLGNLAIFTAYTPALGNELYACDGTQTYLVKDIGDPVESMPSSEKVVLDGYVYFAASNSTHGRELWRTDGTAAGTSRVSDINFMTGSSDPSHLTVMGGNVYFKAFDGTRTAIWRSSGSAPTEVAAVNPSEIGATNDRVYFSAYSIDEGYELWSTTGSGAAIVRDLNVGTLSTSPEMFKARGKTMFFFGSDGDGHTQLYKSDGTEDGTGVIRAANTQFFSVGADYFLGAKLLLYPQAIVGTGVEPWVINLAP